MAISNQKGGSMSFLMDLGINLPYSSDLEELKRIFRMISSIGYKYVYFDGDFFLHSKKELAIYMQILQDFPLKTYSAHTIYMLPPLNRLSNGTFQYQEELFEKAQVLKVKGLTYHFGSYEGLNNYGLLHFEEVLRVNGISMEYYVERCIEVLKEICTKAKIYNLFISVENLPSNCLGSLTDRAEKILEIIKKVNENNLGVCFDSGHAFSSNLDPYEFIIKVGPYLIETHLNDNLGRISNEILLNDLHQPVGIGTINWVKVISALDEISFRSPIVFELAKGDKEEIARINWINWRQFITLYESKYSTIKT
jgi:sugar phosphate isomerase/epimerase